MCWEKNMIQSWNIGVMSQSSSSEGLRQKKRKVAHDLCKNTSLYLLCKFTSRHVHRDFKRRLRIPSPAPAGPVLEFVSVSNTILYNYKFKGKLHKFSLEGYLSSGKYTAQTKDCKVTSFYVSKWICSYLYHRDYVGVGSIVHLWCISLTFSSSWNKL